MIYFHFINSYAISSHEEAAIGVSERQIHAAPVLVELMLLHFILFLCFLLGTLIGLNDLLTFSVF